MYLAISGCASRGICEWVQCRLVNFAVAGPPVRARSVFLAGARVCVSLEDSRDDSRVTEIFPEFPLSRLL